MSARGPSRRTSGRRPPGDGVHGAARLLAGGAGVIASLAMLAGGACTTDIEVITKPLSNSGGVGGAGGSAGHGGANVGGASGGAGTGGGTGGFGGECGTPFPVGRLEFCGGSASTSGTSGGFVCETMLCDQAMQKWDATCDDTGHCSCAFQGREVCTCETTDPCAGVGCCPTPWPDP